PESVPVAIVSNGFWKRYLGAEPSRVGEQISFSNEKYTVVGVLPPEFQFTPLGDIGVWTAMKLKQPERRGPYYLSVVARLKPGISTEQARAELDTTARRIQEQTGPGQNNLSFGLISLSDSIVGGVRTVL